TVCLHRLGTPAGADELIFVEPNARASVQLEPLGPANAVISVTADGATGLWLLPLDRAPLRAELLMRRADRVLNGAIHHDGRFVYVMTNRDAPDYRVVRVDPDDPRPEAWRDVIPHVAGRPIETVVVRHGCLARLERLQGQARLVLHNLADGSEREV